MTTLIVHSTPQAHQAGDFTLALEEALQSAGIECVITAVGAEHRVHISDAYRPRLEAQGKGAFEDVVEALSQTGLAAEVSVSSKEPAHVVPRGLQNITSMGIPPGGIFGGIFAQVDTAANDPFSEPPAAPVKATPVARPRPH
ncbi:hypothetical protein [Hydrogenophaga sp. 2FB]|uniref:hypothetical protein n=1 Tax=Hydrogenophaga sp. 2FB TaxID=2502187 RepID=UPI0010F678E1|nr:hypothetical protein [Hydrogenophaga sp. 2FB]